MRSGRYLSGHGSIPVRNIRVAAGAEDGKIFYTIFWVAKSAATKKCEIVDKKPDGTKMMDMGKKSYATKGNAEKALKDLKDCK